MVFAALYLFGLKAGVGAETLAQFFKMIRIDNHVGVSATALRTKLSEMEILVAQFQVACEHSVPKQTRSIVAGLDEVFFKEFIILVMMDLRSGYLLLEEITDDRCFDTWYAKTTPRLNVLDIEVSHVVSDRAKALIKMAVTGFGCESGADVFHAQQDISRWLGAKLGKRIKQATKKLLTAQTAEDKAVKTADGKLADNLQADRQAAEEALAAAQKSQQAYYDNLQGLGDEVHPFSVVDNSINDAATIVQSLEARAQAFETVANAQGIADSKNTLAKLRNQFGALAVSVSFWWIWVRETLLHLGVTDSELEQWLITSLLPVVYWNHKMQHSKNRQAKEKYYKAWELASVNLKAHSLTTALPINDIQHWLQWAENVSRQFQRSSSAVEGRNGCLSQMCHNRRGLDGNRLKALTVIHNYDIRREDGTTAAMRLFNTEFPDLFSWLLDQMGELPLPRNGRKRVAVNPLKLLGVPC